MKKEIKKEKIHFFKIPKNYTKELFLKELAHLGYKAIRKKNEEGNNIFFDSQSGILFKNSYRLSYSDGFFLLIKNDALILKQKKPLKEIMNKETVFPGGKLKEIIGPLLENHALIPHLKVKKENTWFILKSPVDYNLQMGFSCWFFSPPFREEFQTDETLIELPEEDTSTVVPYLKEILNNRFNLEETSYDALLHGLTLLDLPLPGAPLPEKYRITHEDTLLSAGNKIFSGQAFKMQANSEGAKRDLDIEYLHDFRVATRRVRFALKLFSKYPGKDKGKEIDKENYKKLRKELAWCAYFLGEVRDLDVFLTRINSQMDDIDASPEFIEMIYSFLKEKRRKAFIQLRECLSSQRFEQLISGLNQFNPETGTPHLKEMQNRPIGEYSSLFILKALNKIGKWLKEPGDRYDDEKIHRLRILFKGLRYTTEFFSELYGKNVNNAIKEFKKIQDCLGLFQDARVAMDQLKNLLKEMGREMELSQEFILTLGALIQVQRNIRNRQKKEFKRIWQKFPQQIRLLKKVLESSGSTGK